MRIPVLIAALLALALTPGAAHAKPPAKVAFNLTEEPLVKPRTYFLSANAGPRIEQLRWTGWGRPTTRATGIYVSDCASCGPEERRPVIVTFSGTRPCPKAGTTAYRRGKMAIVNDDGSRRTSRLTPSQSFHCDASGARAAAAGSPNPLRGPWSGTATSGGRESSISFRVVRRDGRLYVRDLRTSYVDSCVPPGGGEAVQAELDAHVRRMRVGPDGRFRSSDGEIDVSGRFPARRTARGRIDVAPAGLTCSGATITFRAAPVPMTCTRSGGPGCAAPGGRP